MGLFDDALPPPSSTPGKDEKPPEKAAGPGLFNDVLHPSAQPPGLFGDVLGPRQDPDTSSIDTNAPVGSEGFLGGLADLGRSLGHGAIVTVPQSIGQTAQMVGHDLGSTAMESWGKDTADAAAERDKAHPELKQSIVGQVAAENPLSVRGGVYGAGDNSVLSTGPGLAGAAAGAALGSVIPGAGTLAGAGVGYVVGSLAAMPLFYGSQGQQSREEVAKRLTAAGASPEEVEQKSMAAGRLSGGIEAGGELLGDMIPFHQLFHPLAKPVAGMAVKSLFGGGVRKAVATLGAQELAETSTEMAQQAAEDQTEAAYGGGQGATWKSTLSVLMPTALMTLLPGGLTVAHNFRTTRTLQRSLTDPKADPEQRAAAAAVVFHAVKDDPEVARAFDEYATVQIAAGKPIVLGSDDFYKKQVERPDYLAALDHLEQNTGDFAGAQAKLEQDATPPGYDVQEGAAEQIDAAPPPGSTPGYDVQEGEQIDAAPPPPDDTGGEPPGPPPPPPGPPPGPLTGAAQVAQATGATDNAAAQRQNAVDEAAHAAAGDNATDGAEPPAPPPTNPITGALFPFATAEAAQKRAQLLTEQTGQEHTAIPHPTIHDKFAVVPGATEQIEAATAPADESATESNSAPAGQNEGAQEGEHPTQETPPAVGAGENVEGNPPNGQGPEEGGGSGLRPEGQKPLTDNDLEGLFNEAADEVKKEGADAGTTVPAPEAPPAKTPPGESNIGSGEPSAPTTEGETHSPEKGPLSPPGPDVGGTPEAAPRTLPDLKIIDRDGERKRGYESLKTTLDQAPKVIQDTVHAAAAKMAEPGSLQMMGSSTLRTPQTKLLATIAARIASGKQTMEGVTATVSPDSNKRTLTTPWGTFELTRKKVHAEYLLNYTVPELARATAPGAVAERDGALTRGPNGPVIDPKATADELVVAVTKLRRGVGAGIPPHPFIRTGADRIVAAEKALREFVAADPARARTLADEVRAMDPERFEQLTGSPRLVQQYIANEIDASQPRGESILDWPIGTRVSLGDPGYPGHEHPATIVGKQDGTGYPIIKMDKDGKVVPLTGDNVTKLYRLRDQAAKVEPTVPVRVIEAESGKQAIVQMPATEALKHYDEQLTKARGFLECLLS